MAKYFPKNDSNQKFWEWFFQVEQISEMSLEDDQALVITHKALDGDKRTYNAVHLKSTLQKKSN